MHETGKIKQIKYTRCEESNLLAKPMSFSRKILVILFLCHDPITESRLIKKRSLVMLRQSWLEGVQRGKANLNVLNGLYRIARKDLSNEVGTALPFSGTSKKPLLAHRNTRTNPAMEDTTIMVSAQFREIFHNLMMLVNLFRIQRSKNLYILLISIPSKSPAVE